MKVLVCLLAWAINVQAVPQKELKPADPAHPLIQNVKIADYLTKVEPNTIIDKMDSTGKGQADIFVMFKRVEDGGKQLFMQLFDVNHDKKVDLVKHWVKGKMVSTEADLDYDGFVDVNTEYDPQTSEIKKKIQADGTTNIWKYYVQNELRKKELDRNSDGKPDMWVYYRGGKITRTEIDKNFDGRAVLLENRSPAAKSE